MHTYSSPLVAWTTKGLYCEAGGFYIDPHRAVDLAIVLMLIVIMRGEEVRSTFVSRVELNY